MANLLKMAMIDTILSFHRLGWSNRRIARELGIDRDAVSRHIHQACSTLTSTSETSRSRS